MLADMAFVSLYSEKLQASGMGPPALISQQEKVRSQSYVQSRIGLNNETNI
jgi:hypothetical protein